MTPEALAELHARCFTSPRPWRAGEFSDLLAQDTTALVTSQAGFALARVILDEAELLTIAVDPGCRRKGHGRTLLAAIEDAMRQRGAAQCFLEVAADNAAALALYQGAGYAESGRRRGYYSAPGRAAVDALILSRRLAAR